MFMSLSHFFDHCIKRPWKRSTTRQPIFLQSHCPRPPRRSSFQPLSFQSIAFSTKGKSVFVWIRIAVPRTSPTKVSRIASVSSLSRLFHLCSPLDRPASVCRLWHRRTPPCVSVPLQSAQAADKALLRLLVLEANSRTKSATVPCLKARAAKNTRSLVSYAHGDDPTSMTLSPPICHNDLQRLMHASSSHHYVKRNQQHR